MEFPFHDAVQYRLRFSMNLRIILEYPSSWLEMYMKEKEDFKMEVSNPFGLIVQVLTPHIFFMVIIQGIDW